MMLYDEQEPVESFTDCLLYSYDSLSEIILQHLQFRAPHCLVLPKRGPIAKSFNFTNLLLRFAPVFFTYWNNFLAMLFGVVMLGLCILARSRGCRS